MYKYNLQMNGSYTYTFSFSNWIIINLHGWVHDEISFTEKYICAVQIKLADIQFIEKSVLSLLN